MVDLSGVRELSIAIDSPAWLDWVKEQRSFSYRKGTKGSFTCSRRGNNKWYAVKKIHATNGGKAVPLYIGDDRECTQEKLEYLHQHFGMESTDFWNWYYSADRSRRAKKSCTTSKCATNNGTLVPDLPGLESELKFNKSQRAELEVDNQILREALAAKETELELLKKCVQSQESDAGSTQKTLELLDKYLGEAGIPLDDKGKPKARYDQLAKFKSWLERHKLAL